MLFVALIFAFAPIVGVAANTNDQGEQTITRGEFFQLIVEQLDLTPSDASTELPSDVGANSAYADAVRIMLERQVVQGYPDGTVGLERPVTPYEAHLVLGRFLGIEDQEALAVLSSEFGVSIENKKHVSVQNAKQAVEQALKNDQSALELLESSSVKQLEQTSYRANMQQHMSMIMNEEFAQGETMDLSTMRSDMIVEYHMQKGMHINMTMSMPQPTGDLEMQIEQYIVPEGMFMKMVDPHSNEESWINIGTELQLTFDEMLDMQKQSLELNQSMNNKFMFYRDLGTESVDGKNAHKISFNGKITSLTEMLGAMSDILSDPSMVEELEKEVASLPDIAMTMSGTLWIDEETLLPLKMDTKMSLQYGEAPDMPIDQMNIQVEASFYDYNQVEDIILPEAALDAEVLPSPEEGTVEEETSEEATEE
jgi:enamine deaminase RidA (YjgF/YER057c/UK114 family)